MMLKFTRLLWLAKDPNKTAFVSWPVFGPLGLIAKARGKDVSSGGSKRQDLLAYAAMAIIVTAISLVYFTDHEMPPIAFWAFIIICLIWRYFKPIRAYLERQQEEQRAKDIALAVAQATAIDKAALAEAKSALAAELELKSITMLHAAHDLKQPLLKIQMQAMDLIAATDDAQRALLGKPLLNSLAQFGGDIDNTIYNAKLTTKISVPQIIALSVSQYQRELYRSMERLAEADQVDFDVRCSGNGRDEFWISTDEDILDRLVTNLVGNAINASHDGKVRVTLRKRGNRCEVAVLDNGCGIEDAHGPDAAANFAAFAQRITARLGMRARVAVDTMFDSLGGKMPLAQ